MNQPRTLGELKASGYVDRTVKEEIELNLLKKLKAGETLFPGVHGYEETVQPQLVNALLSHHDIVLLGEKGQAKSRLMRSLVEFLDESLPIVKGSEVNDHPYHPISAYGRNRVAEKGDATEIEWVPRDKRYGERLSPGTKIADLLGDLDPAKVAAGNPLASEEALHFGLIPRVNRGIFALNELPDLEYLVQVALFNVLEERDLQIRGYPMRFPLDVMILFTANPEEYTRAGKIITQLKDRIGAEIRTHYPKDRKTALAITRQEVRKSPEDGVKILVPDFMEQVIEAITMEARKSPYVNQKSGVSARLSIGNYETLLSNARRRAHILGESVAVPRMTDLNYLGASMSGKVDLDPFREETVTEGVVFAKIVDRAVLTVFQEQVAEHHLELPEAPIPPGESVRFSDLTPAKDYASAFKKIPQLWEPAQQLAGDKGEVYQASCVEFVLEGLHLTGKLSRTKVGELTDYKPTAAPAAKKKTNG